MTWVDVALPKHPNKYDGFHVTIHHIWKLGFFPRNPWDSLAIHPTSTLCLFSPDEKMTLYLQCNTLVLRQDQHIVTEVRNTDPRTDNNTSTIIRWHSTSMAHKYHSFLFHSCFLWLLCCSVCLLCHTCKCTTGSCFTCILSL